MRATPLSAVVLGGLLSVGLAPASTAQVSVLWDTNVGGASVVATAPDGSVVVGSSSGGPVVTRLSPSGAVLWSTPLPTDGNDGLTDLAVGRNGEVYTFGVFRDAAGTTGSDVVLNRVNADGVVAWTRRYDGPNSGNAFRESDSAIDVVVTSTGTVVAAAQTGFATNGYPWVLALSADGALLWAQTDQQTTDEASRLTRAAADCAGNVHLVGSVQRLTSPYVGEPGLLLSYGPDGTRLRRATVVPPTGTTVVSSQAYLNEVAVECATGAVYVAGLDNVSDTQTGPDQDAFVARFDGTSAGPTWRRYPFTGFSGRGNSSTSGVQNLAVGGPNAVYASTEAADTNGNTTRVETVRLQADGSTAWLDTVPRTGSYVAIRRPMVASDEGAVLIVQEPDPATGDPSARYRALGPDGAPTWDIRRVQDASGNTPINQMASMAAHPAGGVVWLEAGGHVVRAADPVPQARVFVVHVSAMLSLLGPIEVYLNQAPTSTTPNATIAYPSGTRLLTVPAGQAITVRARLVTPPPGGLPREITFTTAPLAEGNHMVSLAGILPQLLGLYAENPAGISRELRLIIAALGNLATPDAPPALGGNVAVVVTNAVTDAPAIDIVVATTGQVLADDLPYGQAAPPTAMPPGTYRVEVRRASTGALLEAVRFTLDGSEGVLALAATGFLNPSANQNGPALTLSAVDSTGTIEPGVVVTGTDDAPVAGLSLSVENPARGSSVVRFEVPTAGPTRLVVVDVLGREVAVLADGERAAGTHVATLAGPLAPGTYVVRLTAGGGAVSRQVVVVR